MSRMLKTYRIEIDPDEETVGFRLEFVNTRTNKVEAFDFEAVGNPGYGGVVSAMEIIAKRDGKEGFDLVGLRRFFQRVLIPDSYTLLSQILDERQDLTITGGQLADVYGDLLSEYANRPTSPPPASSAGRRNGGTKSTGVPSSAAST